ncbi:MAG: hypothetical protein WDZ80_05180 [Candidatus Paceibacterota bacterium]
MESVIKVLISIFIIGMVVMIIVFFSVFGLLPAEKLTEVFNPEKSTSTNPVVLTSTTTVIERIIERIEIRDPEPKAITDGSSEDNEEDTERNNNSSSVPYDFLLEFRNGIFSPNQINIDLRDDVVLALRSNDLNYSVSIAEFGLNQSVSPGGLRFLAFQALKAGTFEINCEGCIEDYVGIIIVE